MRKTQNQPSLATLNITEREQLADWLRRGHYNDVLDRATKPRPEGLGLTFTSDKPLRTFYAKVALFDVINAQLPADKKLSLATFESLGQRHIHLFLAASGDEEKLAAAHQAILNTTIELAGSATTPTQLLALQRLADFPERAALRAQSAEDLSRLREQAEQIRAERLEIARSKENRAKEMHTHKITLDLRKQTLKEKTAAFKQDLALSRLNIKFAGGTSSTSPTQNNWWGEAAAEPTSTSCDAITKNDATTADPHASTSLSQQGRGLGEGFNYATIKSTDHGEIREKSSLETQNSK